MPSSQFAGFEVKAPVYLPVQTINSVMKEFDLSETNIESFLVSVLDKAIQEHNADNDTQEVFSEAETKELEADLKGLGYI